MRLFTALAVPQHVRARLSELQSSATIAPRWTPPEQFHVTVRFIGEAPQAQAERYEKALPQIGAPPVACTPYGLDALPSRRAPSVIVVGLERTDELMALYRDVSRVLERAGLDPESRPYRPHITLARLDDDSPPAVHRFLDTHASASLPSFDARAVHLYESAVTHEGAVHKCRRSVTLDS